MPVREMDVRDDYKDETSRVGIALKYTLPLMPRLGRYVNDGRLRMLLPDEWKKESK